MIVQALDTHAVVKELVAAGFTDAQAEAVTGVVRRSQDVGLSNLATKADLAATKAELLLGLSKLKFDLSETKTEMLKWMVGTIGIQTVVIIGAVVALVRLTLH